MTASPAAPARLLAWFRDDPRRVDGAIAAATVAVGTALLTASPQDFDTGWPEVAAGVGAFVLVFLRRRWPLPLLAIALAWSAIHVAVWDRPSVMVFAVLVLLVTVGVRLDRGPAIGLGIAVGLVLYTVALVVNDETAYGDGRAVIGFVWTFAAVGLADAIRSWRRYRESADAQVRAAVLAAEARTRQHVTEERLAIARELHDLLAHNLSVMNVQTAAAQYLLRTDPDQAEEALTAARDAGRTVLDELRELLSVLRHDDTTDEAPRAALPTVDDLTVLVDTMRSAGLAITWTETGAPGDLAPAVSLAAYRIVQEALTNAAKHGDGAAALTMEWSKDTLDIAVTNGASTTATPPGTSPRGHGLVGMRERATANGGSFEAETTPSGFRVRASLPLTHQAAEVRP